MKHRRFRRDYFRRLLFVLFFLFCVDAISLIRRRPDTYREDLSLDRQAESHPLRNTSVFIASVHRNTEPILRSTWNQAVLNLVDFFGPENVYFSAVESGSQDETKEALMELKTALDQRYTSNTVSLGMTVWEQLEEIDTRPPPDAREPGWIWNAAESQFELRRIPYLAKIRNQAMEPLKQLQSEGREFDKVLWLNDVVFDTEDIVTLFNTRDNDYAAACAMDYKVAPLYYDTFALRDDLGQKTISLHWPWFQSPIARAAAERNAPIPVASCWNGIVVFDPAPFYANPPLQFRGIDDSLADFHLEGSECCLIHADNYLTDKKGVWLNPNVRVGYDEKAYYQIRTNRFPNPFWTVVGAWVNRLNACHAAIQSRLETRVVQTRLKQWKLETPNGGPQRDEPGEACLINEMQIMWSNGWMHL
ncbi:glycosyltransferase family 69 protein [Daldinia caldariorum]|uniref:glycosyltransferase family 69 protein n=1 Tax=Daldinia caldariorum TaxID=326644 RepID=UPI00200745A4|nr:glycosyltransferase family 69 protein [Daldinia caldariorum]KAI1470122.1 glycosyltransferase family 69 protein [Daldinia caldariorum]